MDHGKAWRWAAVATMTMAAATGCAAPVEEEERGSIASTLLAPTEQAALPATPAAAFAGKLDGPAVDVDTWLGFIGGTEEKGLLVVHLSGTKNRLPVAGMSIAFVESELPDGTPAAQRLENANQMNIHFNNNSGDVSSYDFKTSTRSTNHQANASSLAISQQFFVEAKDLLGLRTSDLGLGDEEQVCLKQYLAVAGLASACINGIDEDCALVRAQATKLADVCQGIEKVKIPQSLLNGLKEAREREGGTPTGGIRAQNFGSLFGGIFSKLTGGKGLAGLLGGGGKEGTLGGLLGKGGGGSLISKVFGSLLSFLPKLFSSKNGAGLKVSSVNGGVSLLNPGKK